MIMNKITKKIRLFLAIAVACTEIFVLTGGSLYGAVSDGTRFEELYKGAVHRENKYVYIQDEWQPVGEELEYIKSEVYSREADKHSFSSVAYENDVQTDEAIENLINSMSLSEKIYQMMFVAPESITGVGVVTRAGETTKNALKRYPVGGIIYFANNIVDRNQTMEMISNSQNYSSIPLFIAVDEEGGIVSRLGSKPHMGTTKHPPMRTIGDEGNFEKAYNIGKTLAKELGELGFNVDFAPDADVITNPLNKEIGSRSFGTDSDLVAQMVKNVVRGIQDNGLSAAVKHFPGHGSTQVDTHTGYSESLRTLDELRANEFLPFKAGIECDVDFVMVSHMTAVNVVKEKLPSSISKEIITDLLINELGYDGIVITDSFSMGAIVKEYTTARASVMAVNAGVDMILMPANIDEAHNAILSAVNSGEITIDRIDSSVRKILTLKKKKGMI